ncbi:hypothetical protein RIF29_37891 [Crotalaria pallida]|uniref:Kinesin-like protein KIN-10A n=1 Tax=Crotalaria pallida TaxID=3830 RepID=A0AAN9HNE6_CROPI
MLVAMIVMKIETKFSSSAGFHLCKAWLDINVLPCEYVGDRNGYFPFQLHKPHFHFHSSGFTHSFIHFQHTFSLYNLLLQFLSTDSMAPPTPYSKPNHPTTQSKTPHSKHRLNFNNTAPPSNHLPEHPVEVIARIRNHKESINNNNAAAISPILQTGSDPKSVRVRADFGYRDFTLDGVSLSEDEDLDAFYKKFVEERIDGVKVGDKCTVMMYGPTGSGKSYTMFGSSKQAGIVYQCLKGILGNDEERKGMGVGMGMFVQVTVLEIYNEEIYDLLCTNNGNGGRGLGLGWPKGSASKVKLEVMGKKAKNATYMSGTEAAKISKEIQKVEKRRIVKSTLCNDRSSRSHCMIILDVPTVGGRLMLVDMAGSENIEQAGQTGFEAKMQTGKINQGNVALKRVVESIANGDSHVPFRDSKLTMLLQDSFEDDKSKILMILCASPDPTEIHKTISTLEYGAKAKCIVRCNLIPVKEEDTSSGVILGSRIAAMDEFILKLQMENKLREKERNEALKKLMKKEEEVAALRARLEIIESKGTHASEEDINRLVNERTEFLKQEFEKKLEECQRMANEFVESERRRMEERILQQQEEVDVMRKRLTELESQLHCSRKESSVENESKELESSGFVRRLMHIYKSQEDHGMVKSMDLDMDDQEIAHEVRIVGGDNNFLQNLSSNQSYNGVEARHVCATEYGERLGLSTVYEDEEGEQGDKGEDEEVEKEIVEEKRVCSVELPGTGAAEINHKKHSLATSNMPSKSPNSKREDFSFKQSSEDGKDTASRLLRIQNIFTLCGNQRELSKHIGTPIPTKKRPEAFDLGLSPVKSSPVKSSEKDSILKTSNKENMQPQYVVGN